MKRIIKAFIVPFAIFISLCFINVYANSDNSRNLISSNEIPVKSYELSGDSEYMADSSVAIMSYGKKAIGSFNIHNASDNNKSYNGFKAYEAASGIYFSYSFDSSYLDENNEWYMIDDYEDYALGISFSDYINNGCLVIQKSSDSLNWSNCISPITSFFENYSSGEVVFEADSTDLKKGTYYRIQILYKLLNTDTLIEKRFIEEYEFYVVDNNGTVDTFQIDGINVNTTYNNCNIKSNISKQLLDNESITTSGFYIDKNGYDNYKVVVKKDNDEETLASDLEEFKEPGRYTITATSPLGATSSKVIYVYSSDVGYGYDYYFDEEIIDGDKIFSTDKIIYSANSRIYFKKFLYLGLNGTLKNLSTNSTSNINEVYGDRYIQLSQGEYVLDLKAGNEASGAVITYTYSFTISKDNSIPSYNYERLLNSKNVNNLILKHYEVLYNSNKIIFSHLDYADAYSYAYKIEEALVQSKSDGSYYKDLSGNIIKYTDSKKLEEMLDYYANKRIELSYFTNSNIEIIFYDNLINNLDVLNNHYNSYVSAIEYKDSLYNGYLIINDYTFNYVSDYDSNQISAYCHSDGSYYELLYDVAVNEQLTIDSKYTIVETNMYGNKREYYVYYFKNCNIVANVTASKSKNYNSFDINYSNNDDISVDSLIINSISNSIIDNSIIIIESDAYSYKLVGDLSNLNGLALYKNGNYKITFIDSLYTSFNINVNITGKVSYKDIISDDIYSYTQKYNEIYLHDLSFNEEHMYDRDGLKTLNDRYVDVCKYTYSSYLSYIDCLNRSKAIYTNNQANINEINKIAFELCDAYNKLVPSIDKSRLHMELLVFEGLNSELYVSSTYDSYFNEYTKALAEFKSDDITAKDISVCVDALISKYNALILRGNKNELEKKYLSASNLSAEEYTPLTYDALLNTLNLVKKVLNDRDATQNDVDNVYKDLVSKINMLIPRANYNELLKIFETVKKVSEWKYTTVSINELNEKYDKAYGIYLEQNATQEYVNQISLELNKSYQSLEKCGDESSLHDLVIEISNLHRAIYTAETINPLIEKYNDANVIISERHNQETIDKLESELKALFDSLEIREDKEKLYFKLIEYSKMDYTDISGTEMSGFMKVYNSAYATLYSDEATADDINKAYDELVKANEKLFYELELELVSPWVIIVVSLAALLALVLANNLMKEIFDCELVGLLILWIPSIIALPLLFIFTPFVGGIILLIEFGVIIVSMIIGIIVDVNL